MRHTHDRHSAHILPVFYKHLSFVKQLSIDTNSTVTLLTFC